MKLFSYTDCRAGFLMFVSIIGACCVIAAAIGSAIHKSCNYPYSVYEGDVIGHYSISKPADSSMIKTKDGIVVLPRYVLPIGAHVKAEISKNWQNCRVIQVD